MGMVLGMLAVLVAVPLSGCTLFEGSGEDARAAWQSQINTLTEQTDEVSEQIGAVRQALADYREQIETMDPDDPLVARITAAVSVASDRLAILQSYEARIDEQLASAQSRLDSIDANADGLGVGLQMVGGTAQSVGPLIPGPWGAGIAAIGTLIGGIGATIGKRRRDEQEAIVFGLDNAKAKNPQLAEAFERAGPDIRAAMGPKVARKVAQIRKGA